MSTSHDKQDRWESCPPGTLVRTVRVIRARQRDRRRAKILGMTGGVVALLMVAAMVAQQFGRGSATVPEMRKITCASVQSLLPAYIAGKLAAPVAGQVETHLEGCPHCRERYEKAKDETAWPGQPTNEVPQLAWRT